MGLDVTTAAGSAMSDEVDRINVDAFSMGCWFYATGAVGSPGVLMTTASKLDSGSTVCRINLSGTTGARPVFVSNYSGTSGRWERGADSSLNTWHQITVTYDKSSVDNDPLMYTDGVESSNETRAPVGTPPGTAPDTVTAVSFGRGQGGSQQLSNCIIAEAFFFDAILTPDQVMAIAQLPPTAWPANMQAYWPMRGLSLTTERELCQRAMLTLENATATDLHPPLAPHSNRLGNRSVVYQQTGIVSGVDKWWREMSRPTNPVISVTSY